MKITSWTIYQVLNGRAQCIIPFCGPSLDTRWYYKGRIEQQDAITDAFGTLIVSRLDRLVYVTKLIPNKGIQTEKLPVPNHRVYCAHEGPVKNWIRSWATKARPLQQHKHVEAHIVMPEVVRPHNMEVPPLFDLG